jgi:hypothetical protein
VWVVLAACSFELKAIPSDTVNDAPLGDTGDIEVDAPQDPACAALWTYTASNFDPCETSHIVHPALTLVAGTYTFAPATGVLALNGTTVQTLPTSGTSPAVLSLAGLVMPASSTLRIAGSTPLIIAVHGGASIDGTITVSAEMARPGPGGGTCMAGPGANALVGPANWTAGGGGGGGGFGTAGGTGGTGDVETGFPKTPGGTPSPANSDPMLVPLRGGCSGGAGGEEDPSCTSTGTPGVGGGGGGALQISVRNGLALATTARLAANGGGGGRGLNATFTGGGHVGVGGGGGGSGGAILVEALTVSIAPSAMLCANGGSGGGGTHNNDGPITDGSDGPCALSAAPGGSGNAASGGNGGFGSTAPQNGENGSRQDDGGGGAGGAVGRIRVRAATGARPQGFGSTPPALID